MMELSLFLSQKKATILKVKHKKKILSLPCLFFFLSCSGLPRTSTDTRHWLTICTQKATRFDKVSRRSRCCGQAGNSLSFPCFYSFLSCSALSRTSMDTRHWLTICTQKATRFDKVSCRSRCCGQAGYSLSFPCLAREYKRDVRVKPEYDKEKSPLI